MLKKVIALATTAGIVGALAFGCSSSTSDSDSSDDAGTKCKKGQTLSKGKCVTAKSTDDTGSDATGTDDTSNTTKDSGVTTKDSGVATTCYDDTAATGYKPFTLTATSAIAGSCTDAELNAVSAACASAAFGKADAGAAACSAAISATVAKCQTCLNGTAAVDGGAGREGAIKNNAPNRWACINLVGASTTCGQSYGNALLCASAACDSCTTDDAFGECQGESIQGVGAKCGFGLDNDCITLAQTNATVKAACSLSAAGASPTEAEYTAYIKKVAETFCK